MKKVNELLKNDKAVKIIIVIGFALIIIIFLSELFYKPGKPQPQQIPVTTDYARQLEEQLTTLISYIEGVGKVNVMITLETFGEIPKVRGAAVVCEGGGDVFVKEKVVETVSKVLGVSTARVSVTF